MTGFVQMGHIYTIYTLLKNDLFFRFRNLFVAGEHCDHETMEWIQEIMGRPILDNWWQTGLSLRITIY